jgi:hypothetical protein
LSEDLLPKGGLQPPFGDQVNLTTEESGQFPLQPGKRKESDSRPGLEFNQKIQVAPGVKIRSETRSKKGQLLDMKLPTESLETRFGKVQIHGQNYPMEVKDPRRLA